MEKYYKEISNRKLVRTKPTGEQLETAKAELNKLLAEFTSQADLAKCLDVTRQAISQFKRNGFVSPHTALKADGIPELNVTKERLRPDVTPDEWRVLNG